MSKQRLTPEFCDLLQSFDEETAFEVMSVLEDAAARRFAPTPTSKSLISKAGRNKKAAVSKTHVTTIGPKRPINRWMAFRREYTLLHHTDRC
jgi:hypothetical protein